jgi:hypothetical protein
MHARRAPILAAAVSLLLAAASLHCTAQQPAGARSPSAPAKQTSTDTERLATITKQLSRNGKLPGALLDAQFLEEKIGDGVLGPSDFFAFYALTVPAADIPAWRAALAATPVVNDPAAYAAPKAAAPWWASKADFGKLELFGPKSLTGRFNGWVGLAPDGRIFIYAFTM